MLFEARARPLVLALMGAIAASFACVSDFARDDLSGRPCPCLAGWVCDESQGPGGICIEKALGSGGTASADAGSGGTGNTFTGSGGGDAAVDSPDPDAGPVHDAGGETSAGGSEGSSGDGGTRQCAPAALPTATECPAICDECSAGTCLIRCDAARDCSALSIDCPPGLSCEVACASQDNCNATEVRCNGTQACDVLCTGLRSCIELSLGCADGPCELHCGSSAQVCRDSVLVCGAGACRGICDGLVMPSVIGCDISCSPACGC